MFFFDHLFLGYLLALFLGLGCGSYATMPAHRLPRGEPSGGRWVGPKSKCPSCGAQLRTRDLVPVFNWLLTWGKCHFCGTKISLKYLFIEASCAAASLFLFWKFNFTETYILLMTLSVCLVILLSTEWNHKILPKQVIYTILVVGVAYRVRQDHEIFFMVNSLVASLLACFAYKGIIEQRGGQVRRYDLLQFVGLSGIWLDEAQLLLYFVMAALCIGVWRILRLEKGFAACFIVPFFISVVWDLPHLVTYFRNYP